MADMDIMMGLMTGVGISAACGFRVFLPLFALSLAGYTGQVELAESIQFLATPGAMIALGTATALEIGAYYIPFLDNLLDSIATPAALVAGTFATGAYVEEMTPVLQWAVALIAGGGSATAVQLTTTATRGGSTVSTGGFGNFIVSTGEAIGAIGMFLLAVFLPILAVILVVFFLFLLFRLLFRRSRPQPVPPGGQP